MDLSNEVLNIDFGQVAAKISKVKLISDNSALFHPMSLGLAE